MIVTLNIGLWINGKENVNLGPATVIRDVVSTFSPRDINSINKRFAKSGEPTMVITMIVQNDMAAMRKGVMHLCYLLSQDCISFTVDSLAGLTGHLVGPNTKPYGGKFNPEYFIAY